ncbi:MAG: GTPase [Chloroflexota bacterium]|nr:GTPase [Chloroflexota bacterium]
MPANLPPQYFVAEKRFRAAKSIPEKIEALREMMAIMPKHKGTDRLRAELRTRMAKLTAQAEKGHRAGKRGSGYYIRREGAGQAALVGLPNVGKSQLVAVLTEASPEVGEYPFTTRMPILGMMPFENLQIQLVDLPPVTDAEARPWLSMVLKNADILVLMVDLGDNCAGQLESVLEKLAELGASPLKTVESGSGEGPKKALVVGSKSDLPGAADRCSELESRYGEELPVMCVSARDGARLEEFKRRLFELLGVIRVYTKVPGGEADLTRPVTLEAGSTVEDAAESVHKDFRRELKHARIWGSGKFDGQMVKRDYVLQDGDIVELHI